MAALVAGTAVLAAAVPARAVTTITSANGLNWQIHDIAPPKLDTGSIRAITDNAFSGFGGMRVRVSGIPATDTTARFNGELMRGFNLTYDGDESFATAQPVVLGGVALSRSVKVSKAGNATRWLDTFANTTQRTITVDVAFGGTAGQNSGSNQSKVVDSSSGDTVIGADDKWVEVANPSAAGVSSRGPSAVVNGTQDGTGNFQRDPFGNPLPLTGLEANFYGYKNTLTLAPGRRSRCCATSSPAARRPPQPPASRSPRSRPERRRSPPRPTSPASPPRSAARWSTGRRCSTTAPRPPHRPSPPSSPRSCPSPPRATTSSTSR
jgi:amidase